MHKQNNEDLRYKVPFVPIIPIMSIFFNVSLIVNLNWLTWIRFILWMILGKFNNFAQIIFKKNIVARFQDFPFISFTG